MTVSSVRKHVRRQATTFNASVKVKMVKVADVRGGVLVSATNPWTGKTVDYTVKASDRKATDNCAGSPGAGRRRSGPSKEPQGSAPR